MNYLNENIDSLNKKLQDGEITAEDLAKETVKNIKETDKKINAWITVDEDAKPAENLDFNKNKLAGIPIAIKDNIITNGMKTTAASHILYNYMPVYDATVISKLKKAQATFVGKTNMDEFAMGSSTEHSYYGETHNPWNLDKVPGGSSGGSAAAVASGEVVAALGSDTGGSIRQPAAFNGIFGIKPTYGRVSRWGLIAFGSSLDQIGVMSKRVKDSAEVLNVIAGPDEHDATVSEQEVPDYTSFLGQDVKGLRVAVPKEYMDAVDGEMREVIQKQIDVLKDAILYAKAKEFVEETGRGYGTQMDVRGANFSGGQKQRILIARALACHPAILILDDSSSALDYRTDAALRHELAAHFADTTKLVIAQRISSIMHADHILVLEDGHMAGYGTHEELLEHCAVYREIRESQM